MIGSLPTLRRNLRRWYHAHARELPWRATADPYRIWISEIMLQQTTVKAVVPYFTRFLERFPTVAQLAAADEADVLRLWEGLGYYSRARNIHRAARRIVDDHKGQLPGDVDGLMKLPGIGRYTAGAIVSFAFDRPAPIVEANTLRLYCRLLGFRGDPREPDGQRVVWEFAQSVLPRIRPGAFNQALTELGSQICTPQEPRCSECPVRHACRAFADGIQHEIPIGRKRPQITRLTEATVAVQKSGRFLLHRCGPKERWAGLWDFPRFALDEDISSTNSPARMNRAVSRGLEDAAGIVADIDGPLAEIRHSVTRYRIRLLCFRAKHSAGRPKKGKQWSWVAPADFGDYPLSMTGRKFATLLSSQAANGSGERTSRKSRVKNGANRHF